MKILAIGDIHGRSNWKIPFYNEEWDECVFVGDYYDSYDFSAAEQMANFKEIIKAKKESTKNVILLIGNHDHHYFPGCNGSTSGFQAHFRWDIQELLVENKHLLDISYYKNGFLFSHAGISKEFLKLDYINIDYSDPNKMVEELNYLFHTNPQKFLFNGNDPYGDDIYQTPIWIREKSLFKSMVPYTQIVGHTQKLDIIYKNNVYFIDALRNNKYLIL